MRVVEQERERFRRMNPTAPRTGQDGSSNQITEVSSYLARVYLLPSISSGGEPMPSPQRILTILSAMPAHAEGAPAGGGKNPGAS